MKGNSLLPMVTLAGLLLLPACTGTRLINPWRDTTYQGRVNKLFVLGIVKDQGPRRLLENEFVRKLKERGTDALASTAIFQGDRVPEREELRAKFREMSIDAVLVVKFIKKETGDTYTPARNYAVPQNIIMSWDELYGVSDDGSQDLSYDYKVATMQITLFSVETGKPIWSSLSETRYEGGLVKQIKPFVSVIVRVLYKQELIW